VERREKTNLVKRRDDGAGEVYDKASGTPRADFGDRLACSR